MVRYRISGSIVVGAALLALLPGCSHGINPAIPTATLTKPPPTKIAAKGEIKGNTAVVRVHDGKFDPQTVHVKVGDAVKWSFEDDGADAVSGLRDKGMIIQSPVLQKGSEYSVIFNNADTIEYISAIHPSMKGTVVVEK